MNRHKHLVQTIMDKARSFRAATGEQYDLEYKELETLLYAEFEKRYREEQDLRVLLAVRSAGRDLYADDGELSDASMQPFIDFKRDTAAEIQAKLLERGRISWQRKQDEVAARQQDSDDKLRSIISAEPKPEKSSDEQALYSEVFGYGRAARRQGLRLGENPYDYKSDYFMQWNDGWNFENRR